MRREWNSFKIDEIKDPGKHAIAMGPFGSRIKKENFVDAGIPVIKGGNLNDTYLGESEFDFLTEEKADELKSSNAYRGDLVITHRGTIGQVGLIPKNSKYDRYVVSQSQLKVSLDQTIADPYFVYYFFQTRLGQHRLLANTSQVGVPAIAKASTSVKAVQIDLPPLPEQKAIAHILGTLDDKIELNRKMNETLEEMAQALFKSWFVDFDPVLDKALAAGHEIPEPMQQKAEQRKQVPNEKKLIHTNPELVKAFPDRFTFTEELGWIPEGWEVKSLSECTLELRRGISPKYLEGSGIRVINQKCIRNHEIDYSLTRRNDPTKKKVDGRLIDRGDVLINSTGVGTLGRMAPVWENEEETVVDSHVTVVRADDILSTGYFIYAMLSLEKTIESMGEGSTGQTELSRARVGELQIIVPSEEIQLKFDHIVSEYLEKMSINRSNNRDLGSLRDTLLPKLISGKLRLPEAKKLIADHG